MDAAGAGVKEFLAGKMLLSLRLANLTPPMRDDAATLGPGAKVSMYTILHLLRKGEYIPSYQLMPKMVGSLGTFDLKSWFSWVSRDLELAMGFYLDARVGGEPELAAVAEFARAHFRSIPSIAVESMLCEVLRRRNVRWRALLSPFPKRFLSHALPSHGHHGASTMSSLTALGPSRARVSPGRPRVQAQPHSKARQRHLHRARTRALRSLGRGTHRALGGGTRAFGAGGRARPDGREPGVAHGGDW